MLTLHGSRLVLLLPWKCATSTIVHRLGHLDPDREQVDPFWISPDTGSVVSRHVTMRDYLWSRTAALGYDVAVFVRNPYDRVYSALPQLGRDVSGQRGFAFTNRLAELTVQHQLDRTQRIVARSDGPGDWLHHVPADWITVDGHTPNLPLHPVHYWTHHRGRRRADFIGRVEHFERDFARLCDRYGLDPRRGDANRSPGSEHTPEGIRYTDRLSPRSIALIEEIFADDLRIFGYPRPAVADATLDLGSPDPDPIS